MIGPRSFGKSDEDLAALGTILVAEDNALNRTEIKRQLDMPGIAFNIVSDGPEALSALQQGQYALLLADCHMPVMDGFTLSSGFVENRCWRDGMLPLPFVAFTASALRDEIERCRRAGMVDIIAKPAQLTEPRSPIVR